VQDGNLVNKLGEDLQKLFELHRAVYNTASEGGRCAGKKGRSKNAAVAVEAAADDNASQQVGHAAAEKTSE